MKFEMLITFVRLLFNHSNIAEYINKKLFEYFYKITFKY